MDSAFLYRSKHGAVSYTLFLWLYICKFLKVKDRKKFERSRKFGTDVNCLRISDFEESEMVLFAPSLSHPSLVLCSDFPDSLYESGQTVS